MEAERNKIEIEIIAVDGECHNYLHRLVFGISGNFRRRRSTCPGIINVSESVRSNWVGLSALAATSMIMPVVSNPSPIASSSALLIFVDCKLCKLCVNRVIEVGPSS